MLYQLSYLGVAAPTGLEPAISHVTGGCVNQLHHGALGLARPGPSDRASRIIAGKMGLVKLRWAEVLARHKTRRGIGRESLLVDRGESGYENRFLPDGRIRYMGEGRGHQGPTPGNLRLLEAQRTGRPFRVFLREGPDSWVDLGLFQVEGSEYVLFGERWVYWFTLRPCRCAGGPSGSSPHPPHGRKGRGARGF